MKTKTIIYVTLLALLTQITACKTPHDPNSKSPFATNDKIIPAPATNSYLAQQPYTPPVIPTPYSTTNTNPTTNPPPAVTPYTQTQTSEAGTMNTVSITQDPQTIIRGQTTPIPLTNRPTTLQQTTQQNQPTGNLSTTAIQVTEVK
ncbi:MAG: hypothetical protein LBU65_04585 [Planctomycetaceae bacterium]|jgi:hypothetical protein|nr:hypothetical protein [Planctomycetaceae bacterium]